DAGARISSSSSSNTDFLALEAFAAGFTISPSSSNTDFFAVEDFAAGFAMSSSSSSSNTDFLGALFVSTGVAAVLVLAAGLLVLSKDIRSSSPPSSSKMLFLTVPALAGAGLVADALVLEGNGALKISLSSSSSSDLAAGF